MEYSQLHEPTEDQLRSTEWDLVVIGRGYSALVNCMTRYHTGKLPPKTLLVGKGDPWSKYADHPMGQHAPLLALPGYPEESQPRSEPREEFLSSAKFAEYNRKQAAFLQTKGVSFATCLIEDPLQYLQNQWLLTLNRDGNPVTVRANHVDVCTGPGPGRLFQPATGRVFGPWAAGVRGSFDVTLLQQLADDSGNKISIGERFMQQTDIQGRVLVVGEGPLTASIVEHAIRIGASSVTWVGRPLEMAALSFPESTRYDSLISNAPAIRQTYKEFKEAIDAGQIPEVAKLREDLAPVNEKLTVVLGRISSVASNAVILVEDRDFGIHVLTSETQEHHPSGESPEHLYDFIVVSASSENIESEKRAAAHLLCSLPKTIARDRPLNPIERFGMFAGLEVQNKSLRVLGTVARNPTLMGKSVIDSDNNQEVEYRKWVSSLSPQARMPNDTMGITIGAAAIASANDFYDSTSPDECAQTAQLTDGELKSHRAGTPAAIVEGTPNLASYEVFPRQA